MWLDLDAVGLIETGLLGLGMGGKACCLHVAPAGKTTCLQSLASWGFTHIWAEHAEEARRVHE